MPGVPPDAVENVKRLLRGIFRRGKNKKQDSKPTAQAPVQEPTPSSGANANQQQPISAPRTDKPLPPPHPLTTGQQSGPQEVVSQADGSEEVKREEIRGQGVSPVSRNPGASIKEDKPPPPPPKNDNAIEETPRKTSADKGKDNAPLSIPQQNPEPTVEGSTISRQPNETAEELKTAGPVNEATLTKPVQPVEEKVPVHSEPPPPIKVSPLAPGMSATSGPLEDFMEG